MAAGGALKYLNFFQLIAKFSPVNSVTCFHVLVLSLSSVYLAVNVDASEGVCTRNNSILSVYKSGYIHSPDYYQSGAPSHRSCTWLISTSAGRKIKLDFLKFSLRLSEDCIEDYLQVYNGDIVFVSPTLTERLCGSKTSIGPVYSDGPRMTVYFRSTNPMPFDNGMFLLEFSTLYHKIFNWGTMLAIVMGVITIVVIGLILRYYCGRQQQQRQRRQRRTAQREAVHRRTQQTPSANPDEAEDTGVTGSNLGEPPSYNLVMESTVETSVSMDSLPPHPPPVYPGTDEPETPPPPYLGVEEQPPQYPAPNERYLWHQSQQRI